MRFKRTIALLILLCLLVGAAGCAGLGEEPLKSLEMPERALPDVMTASDTEDGPEVTEAQAPEIDIPETQILEGEPEIAPTEHSSAVFTEADIMGQMVELFTRTHPETIEQLVASQANVDSQDTELLNTNVDEIDPDADSVDVDAKKLEDIQFLNVYSKGTSDTSVAYIQQRLMDLGFMDYAEPTEYYGSMTSEAVKLFQRQNELKQDGILGQESLPMLFSEEAKRYLAKKGMEGSDISRIQQRLYELGYLASRDKITGTFGDDTDKAVKAMQNANGLAADGLVGEMTVELMYTDSVVANLLSFGDKGEIILACQQRLKELGYLTTTPDGNYGNDTLAAVRLFQSRNNLVVDGYLGPSTREILDSKSAVPNGLMIGDEGDTVKRVQQLLIKYGYMTKGSDTGYFGEVTDKAVKTFQKKNNLSADGNVGAKTMAKLTGDSVVRAGDSTGGTGKVDTGSAHSGSVSELLKVALSKLGCKYVWGAKGPNQFDCSGFVYWCLNQVGVKQSYITSYGWRTVGKYKKITNYSSLKAGDIIVVTGHVGIIGENGTVIDASSSQGKIMHRNLSSWWSSRFIVGWRIFE